MKSSKSLIFAIVFFGTLSVSAYVEFTAVPKPTEPGATAESQTVDEEQYFVSQDRECQWNLKMYTYLPVSDDPKKLEVPLSSIVSKRTGATGLSEKDVHDACLLIGQVIASDSGRSRENLEKDLSYSKPLPLRSTTFTGKRATMGIEELFKDCYDTKAAKGPRLVGVCLHDPSQYMIIVDRCLVSDDLSRGFISVKGYPKLFLGESRSNPAYIFHRDPNWDLLIAEKKQVVSVSCSLPVKDEKGNVYPLNITVYKNPFNNRWWLHRADRTVVEAVIDAWPIVF